MTVNGNVNLSATPLVNTRTVLSPFRIINLNLPAELNMPVPFLGYLRQHHISRLYFPLVSHLGYIISEQNHVIPRLMTFYFAARLVLLGFEIGAVFTKN